MNDVYLSLKPIYEHFKVQHRSPKKYISEFFELYNGCYCHCVGKIVLNTKAIFTDKANVSRIIDHETMHHILNKYFDSNTRNQWDNISTAVERYIYMAR